jgi:hypothetical protein
VRCYNHPEQQAVGSCKGCCKGLCKECAVDLGHGLACRGLHEDHVEALNTLIVRNIVRSSHIVKRGVVTSITVGVIAVLGIAMVIAGTQSDFANFLEVIGGFVFVVAGVSYYWRVVTGPKPDRREGGPNA